METQAVPDKKPVWTSKTVGANLSAPLIFQSAMELYPPLGPWVASHPQSLILGMMGLNIIMRQFTTGGLTWWRKKPDA